MMMASAILAMMTVTVNGFFASHGIETEHEIALIIADTIAYIFILIGLSKLADVSLILAAIEIILMIVLAAVSYAYGRKTRH